MEFVIVENGNPVIGGSRGGGAAGARLPKGPDSFVLTYKFYET